MSVDVIIERKIMIVNPENGESSVITVRIGKPYWKDDGLMAACPVEIEGYLGRVSDICANDTFSALLNAMWFIEKSLSKISENRKLFFTSGDDYINHFDILFELDKEN